MDVTAVAPSVNLKLRISVTAWFAFQVQPEISALDVVKPRALLKDRSRNGL